jgi:hypothetical protein
MTPAMVHANRFDRDRIFPADARARAARRVPPLPPQPAPLVAPDLRCRACGARSDDDSRLFTGLPDSPAGRWQQIGKRWFHLHGYESRHPAQVVRKRIIKPVSGPGLQPQPELVS